LACDFLHSNNIIHCDIKPDNILVKSSSPGNFDIRIADFGLANVLLTGVSYSVAGTPGYMPPEILNGKAHSFNADCFSVGSVIYFLATGGKSLFRGMTLNHIVSLNKECNIYEAMKFVPKGYGSMLLDLVK
jgi:serine/threonine protein kinase